MTEQAPLPDQNMRLSIGGRLRDIVTAPIETSVGSRLAECAITAVTAYGIDHTPLDDMTSGYGADIVGTATFISFITLCLRKGDPKFLPVGVAVAVNSLVEWAQKDHLLEDVPLLHGLDGIYDIRDYAAFGLGALLYLGLDAVKSRLRNRQKTTMPTTDS